MQSINNHLLVCCPEPSPPPLHKSAKAPPPSTILAINHLPSTNRLYNSLNNYASILHFQLWEHAWPVGRGAASLICTGQFYLKRRSHVWSDKLCDVLYRSLYLWAQHVMRLQCQDAISLSVSLWPSKILHNSLPLAHLLPFFFLIFPSLMFTFIIPFHPALNPANAMKPSAPLNKHKHKTVR